MAGFFRFVQLRRVGQTFKFSLAAIEQPTVAEMVSLMPDKAFLF